MTVLVDLVRLYAAQGYDLVSGVDQGFAEDRLAEFTWLYLNGAPCTNDLGIGAKEVNLLESLGAVKLPIKRVLVVGNSFGFSTLALAASFKEAHTVALELAPEPFHQAWIERTNHMAQGAGLSAKVLQGRSPEALPEAIAALGGGPDLMLVDGEHTPEALRDDLAALADLAAPSAIWLLHDVMTFGLADVAKSFAAEKGLSMALLLATPSGMAVLYPDNAPIALLEVLYAFGASNAAQDVLKRGRADGLKAVT